MEIKKVKVRKIKEVIVLDPVHTLHLNKQIRNKMYQHLCLIVWNVVRH